jgi:hypothetical protein
MTNINSDVLERVRNLPAKQQKHFHELLADGEDRPREAASSLRQALFDGEVDQDYQLTSQLAVAALTDPHDEGKFPTEAEARGGYQNEIHRLREIDPDDPTAAHLEGILTRISDREEADRTRAEETREKAEKLHVQREADQLASYEAAYSEHKQQRVAELSRFNLMDSEQAEARFMEVEHANVSASLKRIHGIPA